MLYNDTKSSFFILQNFIVLTFHHIRLPYLVKYKKKKYIKKILTEVPIALTFLV